MKPTRFTFENSEGITLAAHMEWPATQQPHTYAIFAHCFTCGKNLNAVRHVSKALAGSGFAVLSFDFTGIGQSKGEFEDSNFSANVDDLYAAAQFLTKQFKAPGLLVGHSLGGTAVIQVASSLPSVKAIATIGAPAEASHVQNIFVQHLPELEANGVAEVTLGDQPFVIKKQFVDDLQQHHVTQSASKLKCAVLILHSPQDEIVEIKNASLLFQAVKHPRSFVCVDGADHLISNQKDSQYCGDVIATWAKRYLELEEDLSLETEHQTVALVGDENSGYTTLIKAGRHFITADEPVDAGGNDFGPTPYQLLSSALATCTAMTLRMYANRKDLKIESIKVHVNYSKRHIEDCQNDNPDSRIEHFERLIELEGELEPEQKQRLLEIADKCPVHRTLEGTIGIDTRYLVS